MWTRRSRGPGVTESFRSGLWCCEVTMTDLDRYEIAGSLLLCRTCGTVGARYIVKDFGRRTIRVAEMHTEMSGHESASHEVVFENDAASSTQAAGRATRALARGRDKVAVGLGESGSYRGYPPA